jgi:sugar O-acyltransferase (sialic acid O-acetyltransferase NeuD family)
MSQKNKKLVIYGNSAFAEVAYECFTRDSSYEVISFVVDSPYLGSSQLMGLPVIDRESLIDLYPPSDYEIFVAITYGKQNRIRERIVREIEMLNYRLASYINSKATIWQNAVIGSHCFIFEGNNIQPFVKIDSNVILWSGNHIGHHSHIERGCFISSHVVISGFCCIQKCSFLGVNSTISNNVTIGRDSWIGPGVVISKSTSPGSLFPPADFKPSAVSTYKFFKISE